MPHIHTEPDQHDMTVSMYIVRKVDGEWKCLVHMHRKIDQLMQIGGHIELNQTPWQTVACELAEEAGYDLSELDILQPLGEPAYITDAIVHPTPFLVNTHDVGNGHYHSDMCFGFVAQDVPRATPEEGESLDLRWYTLAELYVQAEEGIALKDCTDIFANLLSRLEDWQLLPATSFSLDKPLKGLTYKR